MNACTDLTGVVRWPSMQSWFGLQRHKWDRAPNLDYFASFFVFPKLTRMLLNELLFMLRCCDIFIFIVFCLLFMSSVLLHAIASIHHRSFICHCIVNSKMFTTVPMYICKILSVMFLCCQCTFNFLNNCFNSVATCIISFITCGCGSMYSTVKSQHTGTCNVVWRTAIYTQKVWQTNPKKIVTAFVQKSHF